MVLIRLINGSLFLGELRNNYRQGFGMMFNPQIQGLYVGNYREDKKDGFGAFKWKSGDLYIGEFRNGLKHGMGVLFTPDGKIKYIGEWYNGILIEYFNI